MPELNYFLDSLEPHIDESILELKKELGLRDKRQVKALKFLLCNLYAYKKRRILVSRRRVSDVSEARNPQEIKYGSLNTAQDVLIEHKYVEELERGDFKKNLKTEITTTDKLLQWFEEHNWGNDNVDIANAQYVTLREPKQFREDKPPYLDYEDTEYSIWLSNKLEQYSDLLNASTLEVVDADGNFIKGYSQLVMQRKFIKRKSDKYDYTEFLFSGRMPGSWCNMPSEDRQNNIRINGDKVVEIDRPASHINAMYEVVTGSPYQEGYPYDLVVDGVKILKHIVKNASSIMQSTETPVDTARIVGRNYSKKAKEKNAKEKHIKAYQEYLDFMKEHKKTTLTRIIEVFLDKHPQVRDHYLKGKVYGDIIRCWEADIVFEVVMKLTELGIPTLTVYDSFIVQQQYEGLVNELIENTSYVNRRRLNDDALKASGMFSLVGSS